MGHHFGLRRCFGVDVVSRRRRTVLLFQDKHGSERERQKPAQERNQRKSYAVPTMDLTAEQKIANFVKERSVEK